MPQHPLAYASIHRETVILQNTSGLTWTPRYHWSAKSHAAGATLTLTAEQCATESAGKPIKPRHPLLDLLTERVLDEDALPEFGRGVDVSAQRGAQLRLHAARNASDFHTMACSSHRAGTITLRPVGSMHNCSM